MTSIASYSGEPLFTIKAVQNRTGIKPVTLRAWERRYDLLSPLRMPNGYRLYSERDIQLLLWVQRRLAAGLNISQVAEQFKELQNQSLWPESIETAAPKPRRRKAPRPARDYAEMLYGSLVAHNEQRSAAIFKEIQNYFDLLTICEEVLTPALTLIGEAWYRGEIFIATEHKASNFIKSELLTIMQNLPVVKEGPLILVGCGPEEMHELAALMFAVLLREKGHFVEYLGPDLPVDDLVDYAAQVRPRLICLTINQENTAFLLKDLAPRLASLRGRPKLAYAGRYLDENPQAREELGGTYLGKNLTESLERIKQIFAIP
jgi:DNA-binding transcriptional MerR regulator